MVDLLGRLGLSGAFPRQQGLFGQAGQPLQPLQPTVQPAGLPQAPGAVNIPAGAGGVANIAASPPPPPPPTEITRQRLMAQDVLRSKRAGFAKEQQKADSQRQRALESKPSEGRESRKRTIRTINEPPRIM